MISKHILSFWILLLVCVQSGFGAAYHDTPMDMEQPDGTKVKVLVTGGVYYGEMKSLDGLPLIHDPASKYLCYATLNGDRSAYISTGIVYKGSNILPEGSAKKREALKPEAIAAIINQRKAAERAEGGPMILYQQVAGPPPTTPPVPTYPVVGARRGLTLLIAFRDPVDGLVKDTVPRTTIDSSLNFLGYTGGGNNGSVRDFFLDVSNGNLDYTNDVVAYYVATKPKSYYGDVDANKADPGAGIRSKSRVREMIAEALNALESRPGGYDFSRLSLIEGDKIEAINVLFAGGLPSGTGFAEGMWPHMGYLDPDEFAADGVIGYRYQIASGNIQMGTFCHETGHLLMRWPDLYATDKRSTGIGQFGLMGLYTGEFGSAGNPLPPNPFLRWEAGWENFTELNSMPNGSTVSDEPGDFTTPRFLNVNNTNEFFLMEYMRKEGRYANLSGEGLVIWHIDMGATSNNDADRTPQVHYRVSVEQADGLYELESADVYYPTDGDPIYTPRSADAEDFFKAGYKTDFTVKTNPGSHWWDGSASGLSITNISAPGGATMSFDYQLGSCINIGTPPQIGQTSCAEISDGDFDVEGSGADIWGTADQFTVVPPAHTYFTSSKVRVDAIENTHTWAKAGLMVRETMKANSVHASIFVTPGQGVSFQRRTAEGGASVETTVPGIQAPVWLRLDKQDGLVIGYYSQNGVAWTEVGRVNTSLPRENYVAMAVSSHDAGQVASAQFRQFQVEKKVTVTASSGSNGSISPEGVTTLSVGELFWVTIVPDPGFEVLDVTVDGVSLGKRDEEFYSFSFIQESHVIHVEFARFSEVDVLVAHKGEPVPFMPVVVTDLGNNAQSFANYTESDGILHLKLPYGQYEFELGDWGERYVAPPQAVQVDNPSESITFDAKRPIEYSLTEIDAVVFGNDPRTYDLQVTNNTQEAYAFDVIPPLIYHSQYSFDGGGPAFQWNDIYSSGTMLDALTNTSNVSVSQPLSFSFPFYGGDYDEVHIGSNGAISFSGPIGAAYTDPVALQNAPGVVAALWKSYTPWFGGNVIFQDFGDRAVIQFHYLFDPESRQYVQFQIVLHENGNILFYYNLAEVGGPFFVGIQNPAMDNRLSAHDPSVTDLHAGLAIGLYPRETEWLRVPIANATVQPNQTISIPITLDPSGLLSGEYRKNHLDIRRSGQTAPGPDDASLPVTYRLTRIAIDPLFAYNVGSPAISGSHSQIGSSFFIRSSGTDIWGSQDQFYFPSEATEGDVSVAAKINSLKNTDPWAKSGVMIRGSQAANAANVMMAVTPGNGVTFQYRSTAGGQSQFNNIGGISAPVALKLTREGARFKGYYSKNGFDWIKVGQADINMPQQTYSGMAVTSHNPAVSTSSDIGGFRIERQQGWISRNIGNPQHAGAVTRTDDDFVITGGGRDIWHETDQFHLVSRSEEGRFSLTARIDAIDFTHNWAKAALMVRSNFAPGSRHALVGVTPNRGIIFQYRSTDGGETVSREISGIKAPVWVRLDKLGDKVTGYYSTGGGSWIAVETADMNLGDDVQAGMAVTSHDNGAIAQAVFSSVSVNRSLVAGSIRRDVWNNLNGETVQDLFNSPRYQNNTPDVSDYPLSFDSHLDWANNYGSRMSGYLIPKVSGYYTFWLASDNDGKLYLSPDEDPDHANPIAHVNGWTWHLQWEKFSSQKSQPIHLVAGKAYYIEGVHKEGWGADNLSVAWEGPGFPREVIKGSVLAPQLE